MPRGKQPAQEATTQGATTQVGLRELRLDLRRQLQRVKRGERLEITEHGRPVALIVPLPEPTGLERLIAEGRATRPKRRLEQLGPPPPLPEGWRPLSHIIDELREDTI